ncbi:MAG: HlyD family efflux transporter periplasmic adaptor subunit [Bacteroidetes bacterium]|nr:HlyD family efflux transporter periplasmic adaptor subunit [Bacteroidota bacterium]
MKKRWYFLIAIVVVIVALVVYSASGDDTSVEVTAIVESGDFDIVVSTTGELQAMNSTDIRGPEDLRDARVHSVKIVDLVPEGTIVHAGDYVATLDRSEATERLQNQADEIEADEATYRQTILDTTMTLLDYRNNIKDLEYALEEKQIILDQSQYEPPATIRQAEMNLDKAKRAYEQSVANYSLKLEQASAQIRKAEIRLEREYKEKEDLLRVLDQFDIYAPQPGMVIYKKEWGGAKRKVGSSINPWDPVVATLPDLTTMISKTYINEIDISKLSVGQEVTVGIDAFPDSEYTGKVVEVANVGEQLSTSDAKVFEVVIQLNETDTTLRPSMTTVNEILTGTYEDIIYIPLESVHSTDSMSYVLKTKGKVRQIVDLGQANENYIIVVEGLEAEDEIFLTIPEGSDDWNYEGWEIFEKVKQRRIEDAARKKEESAKRRLEMEEEMKRRDEMKKFNIENLPEEQKKKIQEMMKSGGGSIQMMQGGSSGRKPVVRAGRATTAGVQS